MKKMVLLFFLTFLSEASLCGTLPASCLKIGEVSRWTSYFGEKPSSSDPVRAVFERKEELWLRAQQAADTIYRSYRSGKWSPSKQIFLSDCAQKNSDFHQVIERVQESFFELTLKELGQSSSKQLQDFAKVAGPLRRGIFKAFSLHKEVEFNNAKGAFQRGSRSLFVNFSDIKPEDWLTIFIHEVSHALDKQLAESLAVYNDDCLVKKIIEISEARQAPDEEEQKQIETWLTAGLDRGLLAEWRSWVPTLELYKEGVRYDHWARVDWMENLLREQRSNETLSQMAFRILDEGYTNPTDEIFSNPLVQKSLINLREKLRQQIKK